METAALRRVTTAIWCPKLYGTYLSQQQEPCKRQGPRTVRSILKNIPEFPTLKGESCLTDLTSKACKIKFGPAAGIMFQVIQNPEGFDYYALCSFTYT